MIPSGHNPDAADEQRPEESAQHQAGQSTTSSSRPEPSVPGFDSDIDGNRPTTALNRPLSPPPPRPPSDRSPYGRSITAGPQHQAPVVVAPNIVLPNAAPYGTNPAYPNPAYPPRPPPVSRPGPSQHPHDDRSHDAHRTSGSQSRPAEGHSGTGGQDAAQPIRPVPANYRQPAHPEAGYRDVHYRDPGAGSPEDGRYRTPDPRSPRPPRPPGPDPRRMSAPDQSTAGYPAGGYPAGGDAAGGYANAQYPAAHYSDPHYPESDYRDPFAGGRSAQDPRPDYRATDYREADWDSAVSREPEYPAPPRDRDGPRGRGDRDMPHRTRASRDDSHQDIQGYQGADPYQGGGYQDGEYQGGEYQGGEYQGGGYQGGGYRDGQERSGYPPIDRDPNPRKPRPNNSPQPRWSDHPDQPESPGRPRDSDNYDPRNYYDDQDSREQQYASEYRGESYRPGDEGFDENHATRMERSPAGRSPQDRVRESHREHDLDDQDATVRKGAPERRPAIRGSHLPPYQEPLTETAGSPDKSGQRTPRKLTVTRVAAMRSREITQRGVQLFHQAATADGADRSGLTHLTYAQMANYATDAALAVALANTLFLVKPEEGAGRVLLYLLITVAPFAFIAPVIGPFLDRLQNGRRLALGTSMVGRGVLAILMIFTFNGADASWALYPCALGSLVFSKSFGVLKASLTPRVLPETITLVATNSRLTVFGLVAGGAAGAIAAALTWAFASPGALIFTAVIGFVGGYLCMKIPSWVESTEGEVPVQLSPGTKTGRVMLPLAVRTTLWANSAIRIETGFLAMFIAFVVMREYSAESGFYKLMLLGVVGVAAGVGGFIGNALGAKLPLRSPETIAIIALGVTVLGAVVAAILPGLASAAIVGLIGSAGSSLAKVCLDSVIQRDLPEVSRASGFGRSETALQLSWVFGGVVGLLIGGFLNVSHDAVYSIGFGTATALLILGLVQTWLVKSGRSLVPPIKLPWRRGKSSGSAGSVQVSRAADGSTTTRMSFGDPTRHDQHQPRPQAEPRDARAPRDARGPRQGGTGTAPMPTTPVPAGDKRSFGKRSGKGGNS